jgi:ABC-type branched-subunit amino acid transport system ATPase component/ABC-type branched-subunit amino acid transport system permease subunit
VTPMFPLVQGLPLPPLGTTVWGFDVGIGVLSLGLFTGLTYGLLAAGLVLVYRSSRFINFAHGALGVFGAAICSLAVREFEMPYWVAFALGLLVAAGMGALVEVGIVKPLTGSPRVLSMVATLGTGTALIFAALAINPNGLSGLNFPQPTGLPTMDIGSLRVTPPFAAQALLSPLLLVALGFFFEKSRTGLAVRAAASNAEAADTAGVPTRAMSVFSWAVAGAVAAFAVTLIIPTKGVVTPESLGPELLIRGLAAAAIARFTSFPIAIGVATALGVIEQVLATNPETNGLIEVIILGAVVISLLATRRQVRVPIEQWGTRSLPLRRGLRATQPMFLRIAPWIGATLGIIAAVSLPFVASGTQAIDATVVVAIAIVGCSVTVVTGLGGQLSLAQFAYAGLGAAFSVQASPDLGFVGGIVVAMVLSAFIAVLLAVPSLRVQGAQLGVASLAFSVVAASWLLNRDGLLGDSRPPQRPNLSIAGLSTAESRGYFWIAALGLVVTMALVARLRSGPWGRTVVAVRDNPDAARAFSISARSIRLQTAAVGGAIAGLGGALFGHAFSNLSAVNFPVQNSIDAVTATVIGGLGSLAGPLIGAAYLIGIPAVFKPTPEALTALSAAWLVLIVERPGGVASLGETFAARLRAAKGAQVPPQQDSPSTEPAPAVAAVPRGKAEAGDPILRVEALSKQYGGVRAVDGVSFSVAPGEILGLIGPNGAGKTTLFEMISGFVVPDSGTVTFAGKDVTALAPEIRSRRGISRSFQSAQLFPTLTTTESVMVAAERTLPSSLLETLGRHRHEPAREAMAQKLLRQFGLSRYADVAVGSLPTGTRRLVELACTVALDPMLILLDEPSAGIAHSEIDHIAEIIEAIRYELGITLVIIEHDLPMLSALSDRMIAMQLGAKIAEGTPDAVRSDPLVIASYVGAE